MSILHLPNVANQPREVRASAGFALLADCFHFLISPFLRLRQTLDDTLCKMLINVTVPRYWFRGSRFWIMIDVMFLPMSEEYTSRSLQRTDQFLPFHAISSSPTRLIPGISSDANKS